MAYIFHGNELPIFLIPEVPGGERNGTVKLFVLVVSKIPK
jgi:hypothetical protein